MRPGRLIFEISGASTNLSAEALEMAGKKLPVATKVFVLNNLM